MSSRKQCILDLCAHAGEHEKLGYACSASAFRAREAPEGYRRKRASSELTHPSTFITLTHCGCRCGLFAPKRHAMDCQQQQMPSSLSWQHTWWSCITQATRRPPSAWRGALGACGLSASQEWRRRPSGRKCLFGAWSRNAVGTCSGNTQRVYYLTLGA